MNGINRDNVFDSELFIFILICLFSYDRIKFEQNYQSKIQSITGAGFGVAFCLIN